MRITVVFGFVASLFAPCLFAHGYEDLVRQDLTKPTNLAPFATATTADSGLWVLAPSGNDQHQLVRLDSVGNPSAYAFLPTAVNAGNAEQFSLYPLADGGVLELDTNRVAGICVLRRITREGLLRFERKRLDDGICQVKLAPTGQAPYLLESDDETILLDDGGNLVANLASGSDTSAIYATDFVQSGNDLLLLRRDDLRAGYVLARSRADGSALWSSSLTNIVFAQTKALTIRALNDGRALVLIADAGRLQLQFYSPSGVFIGANELAGLEQGRVYFGDWARDEQGNQALALRIEDNNISRYGALIFNTNGAFLKQVRYSVNDQCVRNCPLLGLAQGFATTVRTTSGAKLVIINPASNSLNKEVDVSGAFHPSIALDSNDAILVSSEIALRAFNQNGIEIAPPILLAKGRAQPKILATTISDDGKSFVLYKSNDGDLDAQLRAFDANGLSLWQRTIPEARNTKFLANSTRVCMAAQNNTARVEATLSCYASETGDELNVVSLPDLDIQRSPMRFLSDRALRVVFQVPIGLTIVDISDDNELRQWSIIIPRVSSIADISGVGDMLITRGNTKDLASEWLYLRESGEFAVSRLLAATTPTSATLGRVVLDDSPIESVLLIAPTPNSNTGEFDIERVLVDGSPRWNKTISAKPAEILFDNSNIYLNPVAASPAKIQALAIADGRTVWDQEIGPSNGNNSVHLQASNDSNEVLLSIDYGLGTQLTRLDSANGAVLEQRTLGCKSAACAQLFARIDAANAFRTIVLAQDSTRADLVFGRTLASIQPELTLDQIGLSGAWYSPQINGQGLFIEYFPQNGLLFSPWFTFASANSETSGEVPNSMSASNLRWYTVSGRVSPGAKATQLEIRRNTAGKFDSAPITASEVVGKAVLRATDCNQATLTYTFFGGEAPLKSGVLPLDRLTGGSAACQLPSGEIRPGRDARPAFRGFDSRQSGSWYQPTTAGQGLMMTVQPATNSTPGFFFGGWFTYDAGTPNDPTSQHWLTLSGEIPVNAQPGVVDVAIYRTLGGQLAAVPTQNNTIVGHGTITFSGCEAAVLRYQFDDALTVGAFKARSGQINLSRLGACPAQ